jgi:homoserine O-succinyltransferase/O-acetyltransferase
VLLTPTEKMAPSSSEALAAHPERIVIGLVNNMPDPAIRATERQFGGLLQADGIDVALQYFHLPEVPRSETARSTFLQSYAPIEQLWDSQVDGLIVTGAEPRAPRLQDEPYWSTLTKVIDWAEENTISTIWSCLAAHAAVLHIDKLERHPLGSKLFGVFDCVKSSEHPILMGVPARLPVPHSRLNALDRDELVARDYQVITSSSLAGADMFLKQRKSLFVFFQGHLEYDAQTLLREYVRDATRFINGERAAYPEMPYGYFEEPVMEEFERIRQQAIANPGPHIIAALAESSTGKSLMNTWRGSATNIYKNWLLHLAAEKSRRRQIS